MPECKRCKDHRWLYEYKGEQLLPIPCICLKRENLIKFIGRELYNAPVLRSDLYNPVTDPETGKITGDRTLENLFLKGTDSLTRQHLRWVLSAKFFYTPKFTYLDVSDEKLLRVWLGDYSYKSRKADLRDSSDTHNNLSELLGSQTLVLIRLGVLSYTNKAMPDVLREALNIRALKDKPVWIIEGPVPFAHGHIAYDETVSSYIEKNFEVVDLGGDAAEEHKIRRELADHFGDTVTFDDAPKQKATYQEDKPKHKSGGGGGNKWKKKGQGLPEW